jgi:hypothetical protein
MLQVLVRLGHPFLRGSKSFAGQSKSRGYMETPRLGVAAENVNRLAQKHPDFRTTFAENNRALTTTIVENETTLIENRSRIPRSGPHKCEQPLLFRVSSLMELG